MKNTKILFIRLYIGTLYSNFIVPLRGSNYTQLLYGDLQKRLGFFFGQTRQLAWQERINEVGLKLYESWVGFEAKIGADRCKSGQISTALEARNVTEVLPKCHHQITTEIPPEMSAYECKRVQKIGSVRVKSGQKTGVTCDQMLPNATKNRASTYHYLILPNSSFMFCVGQKLL